MCHVNSKLKTASTSEVFEVHDSIKNKKLEMGFNFCCRKSNIPTIKICSFSQKLVDMIAHLVSPKHINLHEKEECKR